MQVQSQQQIQESTSQQSVLQNTEQQIVQVCIFNVIKLTYKIKPYHCLLLVVYFQVQIQGQQQGQMLGQVLQVPAGSHQLQGVTTAQLIQPGDLTEEQQQQVWTQNNSVVSELVIFPLIITNVLASSPVGGCCCWRSANPDPDGGSPLTNSATGQCREKGNGDHSCHISRSRCPPASQKA